MGWLLWIGLLAGSLVLLSRTRLPLAAWTVGIAGVLLAMDVAGWVSPLARPILWTLLAVVAIPLNLPLLRRALISGPLMGRVQRTLPPISDSERQALEAGTVGWEADLFGGQPDWRRLLETPRPVLSDAEQAFLDGPVEELCRMLDDWHITHERFDLPPEVWAFLKQHRFFGMIVPREHDGHGFSALANSSVVMKVASRSVTAGVTVMVPNSLGPAELLLQYGSDVQKTYYLPRLARGEEIPCFALTGPWAGSDASSIPDHGILRRGRYKGREVLGFRVTWEKRYITLGPVATLLGLAFRALDPDHLLGDTEDLGITCALIPTDTPGVEIGHRHLPLNIAFQNGPNRGRDVFVPLEWVIGEREGIGQGWRMLVESLSAGRGISLPALGTGSGKLASRLTGAYARIRYQFRLPIGRFEGVREALARIAGTTYIMDAARLLTLSAIDRGERPAVATGILKYQLTEGMRRVINDAMDVHGGRGVCMGPSNYLARIYQSIPIAITVEGANILTRSMIIFGQGAMRCHPYLRTEVHAAAAADLRAFDQAVLGHAGHTLRNGARALVYGLAGRWLAPAPATEFGEIYRRLGHLSAAFAVVSDLVLLFLGGAVKRREHLSGRFADALGHLYLGSAVLKRFEDNACPEADRPLVRWGAEYCLHQVQAALDGVLRHFPVPVLGALLRSLVFPLGRCYRPPADELGGRVADLLLSPSEARDRLTAGVFWSTDATDPVGRVEHAFLNVIAAESAERKLKDRRLSPPVGLPYDEWLARLAREGVLDAADVTRLQAAHDAIAAAIRVDDFAPTGTLSSVGEPPARVASG